MRTAVLACGAAVYVGIALAPDPAAAQFPPNGATYGPGAREATTTTVTPKTIGSLTVTTTYVYLCSRKRWFRKRSIETGTAVFAHEIRRDLVGTSLPPGPPVGATTGADPNRAFNPATGQNYTYDPKQKNWINVSTGEAIIPPNLCPETGAAPQPAPQVGMVTPGPSIKISGELGGGWSRNGFEDFNFHGSGIVGGVSGQFNFPIGASTYAGFSVSVLGSGISGTLPDPTTSNIRWLVPIDGILGATFMPSGLQWPLSVYAFGGLAIGDVKISAPPFSATQTMTGWSVGVGTDLQLTPTWSVGVKYRHFDLGRDSFSVFPGATSLVTERGDMVTGTLSYRFPVSLPAPVAPIVTK
jgi:outer membrane immunogenic protein